MSRVFITKVGMDSLPASSSMGKAVSKTRHRSAVRRLWAVEDLFNALPPCWLTVCTALRPGHE
jgi:hypothetical protein